MPGRIGRPGITRVGTVRRIAMRSEITGWGLSFCMARCPCHLHPVTGQLDLLDGPPSGSPDRLGLHKHRPCLCCEPWTVDELEAALRTLVEIEAITTTIEELPS